MDYNRSWSELNERLREAETGGGLTAALAELERHQRENGFIRDDLADLQRYAYPHPEDPARCFRVQYNPKRALRFSGAGLSTPPDDAQNLNNGCFLCRENIRWQQHQMQVGFEVNLTGDVYNALMNPFPLFPNHVVFAAAEHIPQAWDAEDRKPGFGLFGHRSPGGRKLPALLRDLCELASRLPGHVAFYNGVDAGASIPGHLHFQVMRRLYTDPLFPLEQQTFHLPREDGGPEMVVDYPVEVALWRGPVARVAPDASAWVKIWAERNHARIDMLSSNFIAAGHAGDGDIALYFIPRLRERARWNGNHGLVGGLELLGELVLSTDDERSLLDHGLIDYGFVENALRSVRTPMFVD